jgi:hypothetical protein
MERIPKLEDAKIDWPVYTPTWRERLRWFYGSPEFAAVMAALCYAGAIVVFLLPFLFRG